MYQSGNDTLWISIILIIYSDKIYFFQILKVYKCSILVQTVFKNCNIKLLFFSIQHFHKNLEWLLNMHYLWLLSVAFFIIRIGRHKRINVSFNIFVIYILAFITYSYTSQLKGLWIGKMWETNFSRFDTTKIFEFCYIDYILNANWNFAT